MAKFAKKMNENYSIDEKGFFLIEIEKKEMKLISFDCILMFFYKKMVH